MKIPVPLTKETTPDKAIIPTALVIEPKVVGIQASMGGMLVARGETPGKLNVKKTVRDQLTIRDFAFFRTEWISRSKKKLFK